MIRLVCIVEIEEAETSEEAQNVLDAFRDTVLPAERYGVTIYRATRTEAGMGTFMPGPSGLRVVGDRPARETCTCSGAASWVNPGAHHSTRCALWRPEVAR